MAEQIFEDPNIRPSPTMVEAAPWVHGFVNSQKYRAVYLPLRLHTHLNLCLNVINDQNDCSQLPVVWQLHTFDFPQKFDNGGRSRG